MAARPLPNIFDGKKGGEGVPIMAICLPQDYLEGLPMASVRRIILKAMKEQDEMPPSPFIDEMKANAFLTKNALNFRSYLGWDPILDDIKDISTAKYFVFWVKNLDQSWFEFYTKTAKWHGDDLWELLWYAFGDKRRSIRKGR